MESRIRQLSQLGQLEYKELTCLNYEDLLSNFDTVVFLHQKRWQSLESKIGGLFSNKLFSKFLKKITEEFYRNNWLSIYGVFLNGKPIAVDYNLKFNKKICCYVGGFDPLYKHYSPGVVCFWESLQFYINNGYQEYDFLKGDETYKNIWADKFRKELDVLIIKDGPKGMLFLFFKKFCMLRRKFVKKYYQLK